MTRETRNLLFGIVGLVCFAALMVWTLSDSSRAGMEKPSLDAAPSAAPESMSASAAPAKTAAQPQALPAAPPVDLFAGAMPDFMADVHARVIDKKLLDVEDQKQLFEFGRAHKDDARPQLLLAWDSMNRGWDGIVVRMYRMAYNADRRAKDDPSMLRDLLEVASRYDTVEFREARDVIARVYAAQALPQLNAKIDALRTQGQLERSARLERLRTALAERP